MTLIIAKILRIVQTKILWKQKEDNNEVVQGEQQAERISKRSSPLQPKLLPNTRKQQ